MLLFSFFVFHFILASGLDYHLITELSDKSYGPSEQIKFDLVVMKHRLLIWGRSLVLLEVLGFSCRILLS